jgi:outer membrane protein
MSSLAVLTILALTPISVEEVRAAARANLDAVRAEIAVRDAKAGQTLARSAIFPQLSLNAGASDLFAGPQRRFNVVPVQSPSGEVSFEQRAVDVPGFNQGNFSLQLTVNQLIYDGGAWWNQIAKSNSEFDAASGQLEEQRLSSELEAVRRFFQLLLQQLTLDVLGTTVRRSEEQLARAKSLFEAGRGSKRDVLDAEVNLRNDRISVLKQQQAIAQARIDLSAWINRLDDDLEAISPPLGRLVPVPGVDDAKKLAASNRPLFRALDAQLRAAELGAEVAKSGFFPRVSAQASYGRNSPTADPFFTDFSRQNSLNLGLNINWDIFSGFQTQAQVERSRLLIERTAVEQRQQRQTLEAEVRRGVAQLATQGKVASLANENVRLSQEELSLEEQRYSAGAGSPLEVRNAQLRVTQAQLTQVQGQVELEISKAALERSLGTKVEAAP